mgnify:CR=1 FL=1
MRIRREKSISKWFYYFTLGMTLIFVYKFVSDFGALWDLAKRVISVIMPFIMGIIVAYLFYRPITFLERILNKNKALEKISRPVSIFAVYIIAILLIILLINCVMPPIKESIQELVNNYPNYIEDAKNYVANADENSILKKVNVEEIINKVQSFDIGTYLSTDRILGYINTVIGVFGAVFNIFVTIVISIYILLQRKEIKEFLKKLGKSLFDEPAYTRLSKYFTTSNKILLDFIYCQIIDAIIIGILVSVALSIIGVKYLILLGFFIGVFNIIPYFGAIIAIAVAVLITVFTGGVQQALIMAVTVIILQQIDANIINPKILGDGLKISPILVIFAVTVGGEFFGVIGMFLAVPVIAVMKLLIVDFIEIREKKKKEQMEVKNS